MKKKQVKSSRGQSGGQPPSALRLALRSPITRAERLRAWAAAGCPSQKGPKGGKLFFGWTFDQFYALCRAYVLTAPDLSMAASHAVGFDEKDGYRAMVLAAARPGYYWVAVQMADSYQMITFPAACREQDVLPAIARWAPGVQFHWTSSPGPRTIAMPFSWRVPERYLRVGPRLYFSYSMMTGRVSIGVSQRIVVRVGQKHAQLLGCCKRGSELEALKQSLNPAWQAGTSTALEPHTQGWYELTPSLLRKVYRWGATHFHNMVLGRNAR